MIGGLEFIVLLVLISTAGKVLTARQERQTLGGAPRSPEEIRQLNDAINEIHTRVVKLEEERDFYRALLESPKRDQLHPPPDGRTP